MNSSSKNSKILSFSIGFWTIFFAAIIQNTNYHLSGKYRIIQGCILTVSAVAYIVIRSIRGGKLPKTRLDVFLGLFFLSVLFSFFNSPDIRLSIDSVLDILTHLVLFYLLFDLFQQEINRDAFLWGCLATIGLFLFQALSEVYSTYMGWFSVVGSLNVLPPFLYRFTSMLEHANKMMLVANMMVFFAVWKLLTDQNRASKIGAMAYLFMFIVAYPFSSSRNAILNLAVGSFVFLVLNLHRFDLKNRYLKLNKRNRALIILLAVIVLLAGLAGGYAYVSISMSHPSHGGISNPFAGRTGIWKNALVSWKSAQWTGIGPGRLPFGYMEGMSFPPGWLAPYAHSGIISTLVEFGIPGLLALLAFAIALIVFLVELYPKISVENKGVASAMVAGISSFYVYNLLDDSFIQPETLTFLFMILVVWLFSYGKGVSEWKKASLAVLLIPLLVIFAFRVWSNWAYQPAFEAAFIEPEEGWTPIAEKYEESHQRDPNYYFYVSQGAYAWANAYAETGKEQARNQAIEYFQQCIELEPALSLNYANLAVLLYPEDSQAGIDWMQEAILRADDEVSFPINLGWFFEDQADYERAASSYQEALDINPNLASHPFWQETNFRAEFIADWVSDHSEESSETEPLWLKAQTAIRSGDLDQARITLETMNWVGENPILSGLVEMEYYQAIGEVEERELILEELQEMVAGPNIKLGGSVMNALNRYNNWNAADMDVVPGYILLYEGVDAFTEYQKLNED